MADRTARFSNWFQIISNVAIIIGLGLVVYELNQSRQFVHGQMIDQITSRQTDRMLVMMGENPQATLAKAALHPADLNERDVVTLDALYSHVVLGWGSQVMAGEALGLDLHWREAVPHEAQRYFGSGPGRRWLKAWSAGISAGFGSIDEVFELALRAVSDASESHYQAQYDLLLAKD
mgnify:FL=1